MQIDPSIDSRWYRPDLAAAPRAILIVYPHPDDESFTNAGTILRYSAAGVGVHYACATLGECGSVDPALLAGYPSIAALRSDELACAAQTLGLAAVHYLGYRDSGMAGTPDNAHPDCFAQAPLERVVGQLVALIRAVRPQVVLTFNPYGGYGHPDHIVCHHAATQAMAAAADPQRYPEQIARGLAAYQPERLYYPTFPVRLFRLALGAARLIGRDPRRFGRNGDIDAARIVAETTPITTSIDGGAYLEQKERAWDCHRSQLGGGMSRTRRLPLRLRRMLYGVEHFTRVIPGWDPRVARERDLFGDARI